MDEARKKARAALAAVDEGKDPLGEKQTARAGETVSDLCDAYLARHAPLKKSGKTDESRIELHIRPAWGNKKVQAIRRADVAALHHKIGVRVSYEVNRILALIAVMFEKAKEWGHLPDDHHRENPARGVQRFKESKRDRWMTPAELPTLAPAIDAEPNYYARQCLWLYLLTGARRSELLTAKWSDLDWERRELRIPDPAGRRSRSCPDGSE